MRTNIFLVSIFLSINCFAQEVFNASLLKEDFNILTTVVCEVSPNLSLKEKENLMKPL